MNAHIENWIKSLKQECVYHFISVGTKRLGHLIGEAWSTITLNVRIKDSETSRSSTPSCYLTKVRYAAINGSAGCSGIIIGQPEPITFQ